MKKLLLILLTILVASGLGIYGFYNNGLKPVDSQGEEITINIPAGSNSTQIGEILYQNKLIRNESVYKFKLRRMDLASQLKAGSYSLSQSMDLEEIINSLTRGGQSSETTRFTIPEGFELQEIAARLEGQGIVNGERFMELAGSKENFEEDFLFLKELNDGQSLEGFLFPSTYEIFENESEESIIRRMLREFERIYEGELRDKKDNVGLDLNGIVTMASIIEREGKLDRERPLMSAVFYNRIEIGMNLQSCATVQYALGERKPVLSNQDTRIDSPFNTYTNRGLPPAPIAAPGRASLIAAVEPADVDYLFFVLTGDDGSHTFTTNYQDHLNARPRN